MVGHAVARAVGRHLAWTAFTVLALALGVGSAGVPGMDLSAPTARSVRPGVVTVADGAARELSLDRPAVDAVEQPHPVAEQVVDRTARIPAESAWSPAGAVVPGSTGERAPPAR